MVGRPGCMTPKQVAAWTDPDAARTAGGERLRRHRAGGRLGLGDALIGAVAKGLGATIVTRNRPDFERQGASVLTY